MGRASQPALAVQIELQRHFADSRQSADAKIRYRRSRGAPEDSRGR